MTISTRQSDESSLCRSHAILAVQPVSGRIFIGQEPADQLWSYNPTKGMGSG